MSWQTQCQEADAAEFDMAFVVWTRYIYFDTNNWRRKISTAEIEQQSVVLVQPALPLEESSGAWQRLARSSVVVGHEDELLRHYKSFLQARSSQGASQWHRSLAVLPIIFGIGQPVLVPSHGTSDDVRAIALRLGGTTDGDIFFDSDQGYEIQILADSKSVYVHDCDPDTGEDFHKVRISRQHWRTQVNDAVERLQRITSVLDREMNWTKVNNSLG